MRILDSRHKRSFINHRNVFNNLCVIIFTQNKTVAMETYLYLKTPGHHVKMYTVKKYLVLLILHKVTEYTLATYVQQYA